MKHYSIEQILEKVQSIFDAEHAKYYYSGWAKSGCIFIDKNTTDQVDITIKCMYEAPSPTIDVMTALAEFFDSKNINDDAHFANEGCETCDYGSSYGYTLAIRPEKQNDSN